MTADLRSAMGRDIAMRLFHATREETRVLEWALSQLEILRGLHWERRRATGAGDVDSRFHVARARQGSIITRCNGRWPISDAVEMRAPAPALAEMCRACARDRIGETALVLLDLATQFADEDQAHEQARAEMLGGGS